MNDNEKGAEVLRAEKNENADIRIDNAFIRWIENFWYYHKWHLFIGLFLVVLLVICVTQLTAPDKSDTTVILAGPYYPTNTQKGGMDLAFAAVLPEDYNEDGEKIVEIIHYEVYSTEQFKALEGDANDSGLNASNLKNFNSIVSIGEFSICIIDRWLYDDLREAGAIRPLSDLFGENIPEGAIDEYAIDFKSTAFAKTFSVFSDFPDTTVICLRTKGYMSGFFNNKGNDEEYMISEEMFKAIIEYQPAE